VFACFYRGHCAAINRLAEESARVATETKDRVLGQYDPAKFDSTAPLEDVKAAAADAAREAQATVQSAQSSAADAVHTAQHKVSKMTDGMSETVADVQNKASAATSQAQKEVSDMTSAAYEQAAGMSEATKSAAGDVYGRLKSAVENVVQVSLHTHQACTVCSVHARQ